MQFLRPDRVCRGAKRKIGLADGGRSFGFSCCQAAAPTGDSSARFGSGSAPPTALKELLRRGLHRGRGLLLRTHGGLHRGSSVAAAAATTAAAAATAATMATAMATTVATGMMATITVM